MLDGAVKDDGVEVGEVEARAAVGARGVGGEDDGLEELDLDACGKVDREPVKDAVFAGDDGVLGLVRRSECGELGELIRVVEPPELGPNLELIVDRGVIGEDEAGPPVAPLVPVPSEARFEVLAFEADDAGRDEIIVGRAVLEFAVPEPGRREDPPVVRRRYGPPLVLFEPRFEKDVGADVAGRAHAARVLPHGHGRLPALQRRPAGSSVREVGEGSDFEGVLVVADRIEAVAVAVEEGREATNGADAGAGRASGEALEEGAVRRAECSAGGEGGVGIGMGDVGREGARPEVSTGKAAEDALALEHAAELVVRLQEPFLLGVCRGGGEEQGKEEDGRPHGEGARQEGASG